MARHPKPSLYRPDGRRAEIVRIRPSGDGEHMVITTLGWGTAYQHHPCARCPWRLDAPIGAFPAQAFRDSAHTANDLSEVAFGCHAERPHAPKTCAGFLLAGAGHNMRFRVNVLAGKIDLDKLHTTVELYDSYVDMAVANGVDRDDPALANCRTDTRIIPRLDQQS